MANTTKTPLIIVAFAITLVAYPTVTNGQSSPTAAAGPSGMAAAPGPFAAAPGPALDCFPYLLNMSDCLTYVEAGSNLTKPEKGCCPELANLVAVQPICLCQLLANPKQAPVPIDIPKALGLPSICPEVSAPPVSLCSVLGVPVSAPVPAGSLSPEGAPNSNPAASPPKNNDSGGQSIISSYRHFLVGLAIVLYTTFF